MSTASVETASGLAKVVEHIPLFDVVALMLQLKDESPHRVMTTQFRVLWPEPKCKEKLDGVTQPMD